MAQTTYPGLSQRTVAYAETTMLAHAEPILVLQKYGQMKPIPKNTAEGVKFNRPVPFPVATTPLTEGVAPASKAMSYVAVPATLAQYGDVVEITDKVHDLAEDPVLKDASMLCGEQAAETLEIVLWGVLRGGTSVAYAGAATSRVTVVDKISLGKQRVITRALKAARAKKITSIQSSSVKYGTEAIDAAFIAIGHTDMEADIRDMVGFVPVEKYGSMTPLPYEIGKVEDVRYVLSPVMTNWADAGGLASTNGMKTTTGTATDVYPVLYLAKEAFGCVSLKGADSMSPKVRNPGTIDSGDKLGQIGWVGWKTYFAGVILNETWMYRLECGVSDLA